MKNCNGKFISPIKVLLLTFLATSVIRQSSGAETRRRCPPSSCGKIQNIAHPFRLNDDPVRCGDRRYELSCENNVTVLNLFHGKFHVQEINYTHHSIRVTDAGIQLANCSSFPRFYLSSDNFTYGSFSNDPLSVEPYYEIIFLSCSNPVSDPSYVAMDSVRPRCEGHSRGTAGHVYALLTSRFVKDIKDGCSLQTVSLATGIPSTRINHTLNYDYRNHSFFNVSEAIIHVLLAYGIELSWHSVVCEEKCGKWNTCSKNSTTGEVECVTEKHYCSIAYRDTDQCGILSKGFGYTLGYLTGFLNGIWSVIILGPLPLKLDLVDEERLPLGSYFMGGVSIGRYGFTAFIAVRCLFVVALLIAVIIYKWRRRHLSMYENIERFLHDNSIYPIRYSYREIKQMTRGFKVKLGEGGFGSVFKGNLRSGPFVAIKMLGKAKAKIRKEGESKANSGEDFISEVATIGRIHHVNVVRLIGYCVEGSKRALVYEFMPNGSLDKYISSTEENILLSLEKIFEICLGIARGIAYLHQGCDMQILHFDIKPHNILLDDNFIPKVSDFGLAKLYPVDNSIITATGVRGRGTLGYMAPELYFNNIGGVSYKADVYSFGKLLMEMVNKPKNFNRHAENLSESYFPYWIYNQFSKGQDMELDDSTIEKNDLTKKMIIVALWCIQLKPNDRPSMNKVVEMLEGEVERLEMPPKPLVFAPETPAMDQRASSSQTTSEEYSNVTSYSRETTGEVTSECLHI